MSNIIDEVQQRANIKEIIQQYVTLKKQGRNYVGLCPFHSEKTPSFTVSEEKNFFHCFGCGKSGNIFTFLMLYKNIPFVNALRETAKYVGLNIDSYSNNKKEQYSFLINIFKKALQAYNYYLFQPYGRTALAYLKKRSITKPSIDKFGLGYAVDNWTLLNSKLTNDHYSLENQYRSGLIVKGKNNKPYDYFRNRIIFPIYDESNRVIAFGGRVLDDSNPKYLNSTENYYFKKREVFYGLNLAKNGIFKNGLVILVEGYFDVIMAHQMGIDNVVGLLGTGLTEKHIQKIKRYTDKVVLVFDGDEAGQRAVIRSLSLALKANIEVFVVELPNELDPCEFLVRNGSDSFLKYVNSAKTGINYRIKWALKRYNPDDPHKKGKFIADLFAFIDNIDSEIKKEEVIKNASEILKLSKESIYADYKKTRSLNKKDKVILVPKKAYNKKNNPDYTLLFTILNNPELFCNYKNKIMLTMLSDGFSMKLFQTMTEVDLELGKLDVYKVVESMPTEEDRQLVLDELFNEKYIYEPIKMIQDCFNRLKLKEIKNQQSRISKKIKEAGNTNYVNINELLEEKQFLINEENKLKQSGLV